MSTKTAQKEIKGIELTSDQQEAFNNIITWLEHPDPDKYKTLMGYAGTGKTTLLNEIAKYSKRKGINTLFTATTNKAVKVLRSRVNHENFSTIHSACNIKPKQKGAKEIFEAVTWNKKDISKYDLIIVDECSMISEKLLGIIDDEIDVKVLFCGDPAQLQPINEDKSKCFDYNPEMLDTIVRHGDTIANKSKLIREKNVFVSVDQLIEEPDISRIKIEDIAKRFKNFRDNPDDIRMLCWTNKQVKLWNAKLRIADYGYKPDKPFIKGDIIIANQPCEVNNNVVMNNSEEGIILNVIEQDDSWFLEVDLFSGGIAHVTKLKDEYKSKVKKELKELADDKKWSQYWNMKKRYHDIRHCYAMTTHKSQGSTFNNVILDIDDINKNVKYNEDVENRNQLVYVGMTRASNKVYIY